MKMILTAGALLPVLCVSAGAVEEGVAAVRAPIWLCLPFAALLVSIAVFPLVKPTTLFLLVTGVIGSFQVFMNAFMMTGGGPDNSTTMIGLLIYKNAFEYSKYGLACAQAILLAIVIAIISLLQFKLMGVDVEY